MTSLINTWDVPDMKIHSLLQILSNHNVFQDYRESRMHAIENTKLVDVLTKLTEFSPLSRYQTATEVISAVNEFLPEPESVESGRVSVVCLPTASYV